MKISIVTPVLNGERFLRQTVESVLVQSGDFELEYIIKDGGSTDRTLEILKDYQPHPSVQVISHPDGSLYDAINQGFTHATGDIGAWINADDTYTPDALAQVVTTFRSRPACQWLYGHCDIVNEEGRPIRRLITQYKKVVGRRFSLKKLLHENYINQPACFWRMSLWKAVGGLDVNYQYAADYGLWLKMAHAEGAPHPLASALANFRRCGLSLSDRFFVQQFQEEFCIAQPYSNTLTTWIHWLYIRRTILAYKLMQRFSA